jgi:Ca2+-binding EF-hand superfamily protein
LVTKALNVKLNEKVMKTKIFLAAIGSFAMTMAYSQIGSDQSFSDLDANDNDRIESNEYKVNAKVFEKWDVNNDRKISKSEFQTKVYNLVDIDVDDMNDSIEWRQAQVLLNPGRSGATNMSSNDMNRDQDRNQNQNQNRDNDKAYLLDNDRDSDRKMSIKEFNQKLTSAFIKIDADKDNSLSQSEFNNYSFKLLDLNNDGYIAEEEFSDVKDVMNGKPFWKEWFD